MPLQSKRRLARRTVDLIPLSVLCRLARQNVIVLCYHMIAPVTPRHVVHVAPVKTPEMFSADMSWIRQHLHVISYDDLKTSLASGQPLPPQSVLVTFDDGYRECLDHAAPVLDRYDVPATFFLTTGLVGNKNLFHRHIASLCIDRLLVASPRDLNGLDCDGPTGASLWNRRAAWINRVRQSGADDVDQLSHIASLLSVDASEFLTQARPFLDWDDARRLHSSGHTIGAHGVRHIRLRDCVDWQEASNEVVSSCRTVNSQLGGTEAPFAFPFSGDGVDRRDLTTLKSRHPEIGLIFDRRPEREDPGFIVHRIVADFPGPAAATGHESNLPNLIRHAARTRLKARLGTRRSS